MKRILAVVLVLAFVGYLGCGAYAAEVVKEGSDQTSNGPAGGMVKEGAERLAIVGSAEYADTHGDLNTTGTSLSAAAEYEYMVLDQMGLAVRGTFDLSQIQYPGSNGGNYRLQNYALDLIPKWRPAVEGNISPFIGPKVGARYVTNSVAGNGPGGGHANVSCTTWDWGAVLGVDIFLSKSVSLVVEYDYTQFKVETEANSIGVPLANTGGIVTHAGQAGHITVGDNALSIGLAYWW